MHKNRLSPFFSVTRQGGPPPLEVGEPMTPRYYGEPQSSPPPGPKDLGHPSAQSPKPTNVPRDTEHTQNIVLTRPASGCIVRYAFVPEPFRSTVPSALAPCILSTSATSWHQRKRILPNEPNCRFRFTKSTAGVRDWSQASNDSCENGSAPDAKARNMHDSYAVARTSKRRGRP